MSNDNSKQPPVAPSQPTAPKVNPATSTPGEQRSNHGMPSYTPPPPPPPKKQ